MNGNISGQAAPHATYPPQGHRAIQPGDGPLADYLQQVNLNPQLRSSGFASTANNQFHNNSRPNGSYNQSSGGVFNGQPRLEHWTITKYAPPQVQKPVWRVSQRYKDQLSESKIKVEIENQRKLFKSPLKLTSPEISSNQKRQIEDLISHRNFSDPDQWSKWVLKALVQDKERGKVQAVKVIIGRKKLDSARQIRPANAQYRLQDIHEVNDPRYQQKLQQANYLHAAQAWPQSQHRAEMGFSNTQNFNGQNPTANMQQQGRPHPQMDQMFGQIRETVNFGSAQQHDPRQNGMANKPGWSDHQYSAGRAPPKSAETKTPQTQNQRIQGGSKPKPKPQIHQMSDSEDSSPLSMSDSDDPSLSGRETPPSVYSHQSRYSHKARSISSSGSRRKPSSHNGKGSTYKVSSRSSASSNHHSRRAERDSSSSGEDSASDDSFVKHNKASRRAKGHRNRSREPKIRQHHRPSTRDVSPRSLPRRSSHASAEIRPHRSSMSRKTPSHHREYSADSFGSSPQDTGYYSSSRQSVYGPQYQTQRLWDIEQKESRLAMEQELLQRRSRQLDEKELAMYRQRERINEYQA